MRLTVDIIFHNRNTRYKRDNDIPYLLSECDVKEMTFFNIDAISPYVDDDDLEYTSIFIGKHEFQCILPIDELKPLIDAQLDAAS